VEETLRAVESLMPDALAREMLGDVLRTGGLSARWLRNGTSAGNGNGNGKH
jgi:hypothetical protein